MGAGVAASDGPYFVDMVKDHVLEQISETDLASESYRIYTTLDPDLRTRCGSGRGYGRGECG